VNENQAQLGPTPPAKSHQQIFSEVFAHAQSIVELTETIPTDCEPPGVARHGTDKFFATVAYRWGFTNAHWYFVYVGTDQAKAIALADDEVQERGGKYGCAVFEFDESGTDYELIYYAPCMAEDQANESPRHNHRIDYFETLGMALDDACEGMYWEKDPVVDGAMVHVKIPEPVPLFLSNNREREHRRLEATQAATDKLHDKSKKPS
jgi:hypothetical protein